MKVGITLPQFRDEADSCLDAAHRAEDLGIDGVFCFDHLWPMGQPDRPAISSAPLLGAMAASTSTIVVGTLVARVGLVPDEVLVAVLASLSSLSTGRLIAGIGTGDHLSRDENLAYGLPFASADERRSSLAVVASAVRRLGIPVWVERRASPDHRGSPAPRRGGEPVGGRLLAGCRDQRGGHGGHLGRPDRGQRARGHSPSEAAGRGRGDLGGLRLARLA
jgi:alkanesulfonate monooxygenase SsuD/methylene tetrahydromethanopterin reductase-like flavin-dependent oxidoreductase (luciferase family)